MDHLIREYLQVVDMYYGTYLDGITAFATLLEEAYEAERQMQSDKPHIPSEAFDGAAFRYSKGIPRHPDSVHLHGCTLGEYKERNKAGGRNHKTLSQMFVVTIYGYWEDHFRSVIATAIGQPDKSCIESDLMGEIGYLRNDIVHHRGIGTKKLSKCKVFQWFKKDDEISFTPEQIEFVVAQIKGGLPEELRKLAEVLRVKGAKVKPTAVQATVEKCFPAVAQWVRDGHIEIGDQEGFGFIAKAMDYGGQVFEDDKPSTLAEALAALDKALAAWFKEQGIKEE